MTESILNPSTSSVATTLTDAQKVADELSTLAAEAPAVLTLPTRTDSTAIEAKIQSAIVLVLGAIALVHPGFKEPAVVAAAVAPASLIVAGAIQAVDVWRRRSGRNAAVASGQVKIKA